MRDGELPVVQIVKPGGGWYRGAVSCVAGVVLDVNGFFEHFAGKGGLRSADVEALLPRLSSVLAEIERQREAGRLAFLALPYDETGIGQTQELARSLWGRFSTLVVLGIGGSALGTRAVVEAIPAGQRDRQGLRVEVLDNVDPRSVGRVLESLDLEHTVFNVVSKSGQTAETMAQFLVIRDRLLRKLGASRYREHILVTTDPEKGSLRTIASEEGFAVLHVPPAVGGRFSVLSPVGLLPIAAAGIDIEALCRGARAMDARSREPDPWHNPAALHAALLFLCATGKGMNIHVLMPYCDALSRLAEWYAQLWAESLGKRRGLDGSLLETGQTPVSALGATDQHSQVQLYVEGPRDKVVTFIRVERHEEDPTIPSGYDDIEAIAYLSGHSLAELLNIEQTATELALAKAGRPTSLLTLASLDAATIGQLLHLLEVQTLVMGGLLGVDPLDQPGVEAGKRMTYALAGRPGYDDLAACVRERLGRKRPSLVLS